MPVTTATTYDLLLQDVRRYLERGASSSTDPTVYDQLPRLVTLAERRCALELKIQGFINVVFDFMVIGQSVYQKPDRWRDTISVNIGTGAAHNTRKFLLTRSYEYLRCYWPDDSVRGEPTYYADYDYGHWIFGASPDAAYPYEVVYYELPILLSDEVQSNWLTDHAPQLLLYATLLESAPFLKNDDRIQTWQAMYDRTAGMLSGEDIRKIMDRSTVRKEA
jgi:hypothetical protein